jgi:hypothetical protein
MVPADVALRRPWAQAGDFALECAQLAAPGADSTAAASFPVIMRKEEGEWRVVWSLLGLDPERVGALADGAPRS